MHFTEHKERADKQKNQVRLFKRVVSAWVCFWMAGIDGLIAVVVERVSWVYMGEKVRSGLPEVSQSPERGKRTSAHI